MTSRPMVTKALELIGRLFPSYVEELDMLQKIANDRDYSTTQVWYEIARTSARLLVYELQPLHDRIVDKHDRVVDQIFAFCKTALRWVLLLALALVALVVGTRVMERWQLPPAKNNEQPAPCVAAVSQNSSLGAGLAVAVAAAAEAQVQPPQPQPIYLPLLAGHGTVVATPAAWSVAAVVQARAAIQQSMPVWLPQPTTQPASTPVVVATPVPSAVFEPTQTAITQPTTSPTVWLQPSVVPSQPATATAVSSLPPQLPSVAVPATAVVEPSPSTTAAPSVSPTATATATPSTPTVVVATPTVTAAPVTPTSVATPTATASPSATLEPASPTATATATAEPASPTATATATAEPASPTATVELPTPTATVELPTPTATVELPTPTATASPTPPATVELPTATATAELPTATATATVSPTPDPRCEQIALPLDAVLVLDRSGSIAESNALAPLKTAARSFVELLNPMRDRIGLVTFNHEVSVLSGLSDDFPSIAAQIEALVSDGGTDINSGLRAAYALLSRDSRGSDARPVIVLLTDGQNRGDEEDLLVVADQARTNGVRIITIGLGPDVNAALLAKVAFTPEDAYQAPTADELQAIYQSIAQELICESDPSQS